MRVERKAPIVVEQAQLHTEAGRKEKPKAKDSFIWVEKPVVPSSLKTKSPTLFACICDGEKGGCGCHACKQNGKVA